MLYSVRMQSFLLDVLSYGIFSRRHAPKYNTLLDFILFMYLLFMYLFYVYYCTAILV